VDYHAPPVSRLLPLLLLALALGLVACGGSDEQEGAGGTQTEEAAAAGETESGCERVAAPEPKGEQDLERPRVTPEQGTTYTAVLETNCGAVEIQLATSRSPRTTGSFIGLARDRFFDGLTFHRIVADFVVQGGDPQGDGQGGPGYSVTEAPPEDLQYTRGVVAMAKTEMEDPGTSGSQFFIVTGEDAGLPAEYALLGRVTKGMDAVDRMAAVETDPSTEAPATPVVVRRVTIRES
jgi:peptidyl-prolyl cis-trans isomerase B (cyclophilin B)